MSVPTEEFMHCMNIVQNEIKQKVKFINSGGCGLFAVELVKRMIALGMQGVKIRIYEEAPANLSELESKLVTNGEPVENIDTWNRNGVYFSHIVIEWNDYIWDADYTRPIDKREKWAGYYLCPGTISLEIMETLALSHEGWNSLYKRKYDDVVREILDDAFAMFEFSEAA